MSEQQAGYLVAALFSSIGALLAGVTAYRKWRPETARIGVDTLDVNVKIAGDLRDDAYEAWQRMKREMAEMRQEMNQLREELNEERRARHDDVAKAEQTATEKVAEEREARRAAERRAAELDDEVQGLRIMVTALHDVIRQAGFEIPEHLMTMAREGEDQA